MAAKKKRKMPAFTKAPQEVVDTFSAAIDGLEGVERKTMFSYPAAFANGNMLACVFQDRIMVRLSETDREKALAITGAKPFEPSPGRAMREYIDFPRSISGVPKELRTWIKRGLAYVDTLPAKKPKSKAAKKGTSRSSR
jgi:TfoX/Sxy family transcriptional regulator of competence genes